MVCLINLPPEIINSILDDLSPLDVAACRLSSKFLNSAIRESVMLQYKLALTRAFAEDCPSSYSLTIDKMKTLKNIESSWINMKSDFSRLIEVPLRQSGVYDLSGGVYLLSDSARTSLGYLRLPEREADAPQWEMHKVGKFIVDIGLCVYEHDLLAVVTSTLKSGQEGEPDKFDIGVDLVEMSTGKPHPLAARNPIFVMRSSWEKPSVGIEIVGKHLVLILSFNAPGHPEDRVFVFEWKTGVSVASFEARSHTYSGLVFLDETNILLPNTRNNSLDIYQIPPAPTLEPMRPVLILDLPPLIEGRILGFATCRAEPNPISRDSYPTMRARAAASLQDPSKARTDLAPHRGFLLKSLTALCMFELRVHVLEFNIVPGGGLHMGFPFRHSFSFVAQRQSLIDLVLAHAKIIDEPAACTPTPSTAQAPTLAYDDWGPSCTAWFGSNEHDASPQWITTSAGRRCVRMPESSSETPEGERFFVCEFGGEVALARSTKDDADPMGKDKGQDKGKGKAKDPDADDDANNDTKPTKPKRPTARDIAEADRIHDEEWQELRRARQALREEKRARDAARAEEGEAGPSTVVPDPFLDDSDYDDFPPDDVMEGDIWAGSHPMDWSFEATPSVQEVEQVELRSPQSVDDETDDDFDDEVEGEAHGFRVLHDLLVHGPHIVDGDPHAPLEPVFVNSDSEDDDVIFDEHRHVYGQEAEDDQDQSWAVDPLPEPGEDMLAVSGERILDCPEVFRHPIRHSLPYIVRASRERYRWQGVLLDEERVIGIHASENTHVDQIEVVHFGANG